MNSPVIYSSLRNLIPPLEPEEYRLLEESIRQDGCRDALVVWPRMKEPGEIDGGTCKSERCEYEYQKVPDDEWLPVHGRRECPVFNYGIAPFDYEYIIVDGHNRYEICQKHGIKYATVEQSFAHMDEARIWIIQNQFGRRNLSPYQRSVLALKLEEIQAKQARERMLAGKKLDPVPTLAQGKVRDRLAKMAQVSHGTIDKVKVIEEKATPEQKNRLISGDATVHQVYVELRRQGVREAISKKVDWPTGKYRIIYADPPWQYSNSMPADIATQQDDHYPTMPISRICELPVADLALNDSVLFLWVTSPVLEDSFKVINAWGFKYKASYVWDKVKHNMGHYNSIRHEFLLVAVRGSCQPDIPKLYDSVQSIERSDHSAKPELFREIIDTIYPHGPRIELFARRKVKGWDQYGNQLA